MDVASVTGSSLIRVSFFYIFYAPANGDPIEPTVMGGNLHHGKESSHTHTGGRRSPESEKSGIPGYKRALPHFNSIHHPSKQARSLDFPKAGPTHIFNMCCTILPCPMLNRCTLL